MQASLIAFRAEFQQSVLRFLWRQWAQLGVMGRADQPVIWAIDPEALLLLSLEAGRLDPRLFDEVMDWLNRNSAWLNIQRLRNLIRGDPDFPARLIAAVADALMVHNPAIRWRGLVPAAEAPSNNKPEPLFLASDGRNMPVPRKPEERFAQHGYLRPRMEWRGLSQPVPMDPPCVFFKLRALWGVSARADIIAYLLLRGGAGTPDVAAAIHSSIPNVWATLEEMAASQQINVWRKGREKIYGLHQQTWWEFLYPGLATSWRLEWLDWPRVARALAVTMRWLQRPDLEELSPFLAASELTLLVQNLQNDLAASGMLPRPLTARERSTETLSAWLLNSFNSVLKAGPKEFKHPQRKIHNP